MKDLIRRPTALAMVAALTVLPSIPLRADSPSSASGEPPLPPLRESIQKGYPELFDLAPTLNIEPREIQQLRESFRSGEDACRRTFRNHARAYGKQIEDARRNLKAGGEKLPTDERHDLHCTIQNLDLLKSEAEVLAGQAIPTAYDNLNAKLDLLQQWSDQYRHAGRNRERSIHDAVMGRCEGHRLPRHCERATGRYQALGAGRRRDASAGAVATGSRKTR